MTPRHWLLIGALCIAAVGGVLAYDHSEATATAPKKNVVVPVPAPVAVPAATIGSDVLAESAPRVIATEATSDLFAPKSWYVAPPPPPPPAPTAPAFPYAFAGSQRDGDALTLFVTLGQRNYILHPGDVIDANYRFDEVKDGTAVFTYLPLQQKQTLEIGTNE